MIGMDRIAPEAYKIGHKLSPGDQDKLRKWMRAHDKAGRGQKLPTYKSEIGVTHVSMSRRNSLQRVMRRLLTPMTPGIASEALGCTVNEARGTIDALCRDGLVERQASGGYVLTAAGE